MSATATATAARPRILYRALLRELPPISRCRTKLHDELRSHFYEPRHSSDTATQFLAYLKSQRMYVTLLERYNPGLLGEMDVQENVRLTARRVGLELSGVEGPKREE